MTTPLRILLLEDQGFIREAIKLLLEDTFPTAQIQDASNYEQAITILSNTVIDFVFLDIDLSGRLDFDLYQNEDEKSGLDVLDFIRTNKINTSAIMLTAADDAELEAECRKRGAVGYIPKSINGGSAILRQSLEEIKQGRLFIRVSINGNRKEKRLMPKTPEEFSVKGRLCEVLYYLYQGDCDKEIARKMNLAGGTVRDYVSDLLKLFEVSNRTQLAIKMRELNIKIPQPNPIPIN